MPFYRFTVPPGSTSWERRADIAVATTKVHSELTGAPGRYVHCSFAQAPADTTFVAGEALASHRMIGLLRDGRSAALRGRLLHGIADAWSEIAGEPKENLAIFLHEVPGANVLEDGVILPEAGADPGAITH
ncbi:MAG TPA: tautomerase family protein [Actinospica sp.]|jgi:phenylpyruvate tautomerase PptA (4-oxalocrotonate tautomerase family)|nr:tautomerase family protein [Actinospica sp.]